MRPAETVTTPPGSGGLATGKIQRAVREKSEGNTVARFLLRANGHGTVGPISTSRQKTGTSSQADWYVASNGTRTYTSGVRNSGISFRVRPTAVGSTNASGTGPAM